ncbi:MAG: hypothetical protein NVS4B3_01950 [Gemmatimonadaceae bacterium]
MPNRAECEAVVRQLWPFLDGALPHEDHERVVAHLEACANCRSHFDFEQAFLDAVRSSVTLDGNFESLRTRVLGALSIEGFAAL